MKLSFVVATPEVRKPVACATWSTAVLSSLADIGYGAVELQIRDPREIERGRVLTAVRSRGLEVAGVSTGPVANDDGLLLTHRDESVRAEALRRLLVGAELAAECGAHVTIGGIRGFSTSAPSRTVAMSWLSAGLERLLSRADQLDVRVVIEPQNRSVTDIFNRMADAVAFVKSVGSSRLVLEADSYHMALEERSVPAALVLAHGSGLLAHVQVSDSNRLAPGWGHLNWADFVGTLEALGYCGWISVESSQEPDTETAALQGFRMMQAVGSCTWRRGAAVVC